jgi:hypothetical protein
VGEGAKRDALHKFVDDNLLAAFGIMACLGSLLAPFFPICATSDLTPLWASLRLS